MRICLKAAIEFGKNKLGTPVVIGNEKRVKETLNKIGLMRILKLKLLIQQLKEKRKIFKIFIQKVTKNWST